MNTTLNKEFPLLSNDEALIMTNSVVDQILKVDQQKRAKALYYWQGIITSLAMIIDSQNSIDHLFRQLIKTKATRKLFADIKSYHQNVKEDAEYNYNEYEKLLLELGVII